MADPPFVPQTPAPGFTRFFTNVVASTLRSVYNSTTGVTAVPTTYLTDILAHLSQMGGGDYQLLPAGAVMTQYRLNVDWQTDIIEGDRITNIRQNDTTPWPGISPNEYFEVVYVHLSTPGILPRRTLFLNRIRGGGPTY